MKSSTAGPACQKYLIITCDTEALPKEAPDQHVDRLIWGKFPEAPEPFGINMMMDIADEIGAKISYFLDVFERLAYGADIDRVAHFIQERGHDLQLHLHIEFLPPEFWQARGFRPPTWAMNLFDYQAARAVLGYGMELFQSLTGTRPAAYRGGAFRYNSHILEALRHFGIPLSFQYNPATALKANYPHGFDAGPLPLFQWSNGVVEVPCGTYENPQPRGARPRYKGFELQEFAHLDHALMLLNSQWQRGPLYKVAVIVLHSWSFLERNETGQFIWKGDNKARLFRDVLRNLPSDVRVVSASELLALIQSESVQPAFEMPVCVAGTEGIPAVPLPGNTPARTGVIEPHYVLPA